MNSRELREKFFDFFKKRGHTIVKSSSLIPDDPSVLLTTAGMQQFKKYYTGELDAMDSFGSQRTVSIQKSFRTSDIEEVGDETHLTFFEMFGNFSFGPVGTDNPEDTGKIGYFKRASIYWAYEFITNILEISENRIYVSVFAGDKEISFDQESYDIWKNEIKIPENRIFKGSRQDNFWGPTGEEGPCGPSTEIYITPSAAEAEAGKGVEIWNIVFNEFYKNKIGIYQKTENLGVDTGMGMERLAVILQGVNNVFETDLFVSIMAKINELTPSADNRIKRILADHLRGAIFLVADGVLPSNKEAGYVLRRLLRRILAYQIVNDIHADLFAESVEIIKNNFGEFYPELNKTKEILNVLEEEKVKFEETIGRGIREIEKYKESGKEISGSEAFYLYETFGLPFELIKELAPSKLTANLNKADFDREFEKHQEISRAGAEKKFGGHGLIFDTGELKAATEEEMKKVIRLHTATHLLQWALRQVLGNEVKQMGSDITSERLRFDFSFGRKITPEEIKQVENLVNEKINLNLPVYFEEMSKEEAEKSGALAFFRQKYPSVVKVYFIGFKASGEIISKELCGGPHVEYTSEIGKFKIIKEESVGMGIRRIKTILSN
ncbi:MAG: alanine--tRNA ligase [Patescibacteria group bacterium]|nr:alanine--tRNA ligase [Patescibacteria group bacterium]